MSCDEWESWIAYNNMAPIGPLRADIRAAIVAQTVANCNIGRNQRPFSRTDFMPFYEAPQQTDEEIGDMWLAWGKRMKASIDAKKAKQRRGK